MKNLLSADNVLSLLKLGLPDEGKGNSEIKEAVTPSSLKARRDALCSYEFEFEVDRDSGPIELVCAIVDYEPPDIGGCWDEKLGCRFNIEAHTLDGTSFELTMLEYDRAERRAVKHIEEKIREAEEDDI